MPTLSLYGQQNSQSSSQAQAQGANIVENKDISINLSQNDQSLNLSAIGAGLGKPDFSIKIEESTKSHSNNSNYGGNSQTFTNIDTVNQVSTVLSVYTNSNAENLNSKPTVVQPPVAPTSIAQAFPNPPTLTTESPPSTISKTSIPSVLFQSNPKQLSQPAPISLKYE